MKRKDSILTLFAGTLALFSCQKIIKVDLNSSAPKVVIEGSINDQPGPHFVKVSQTVNFDQTNVFPAVTGAIVTISDDAGNTETLTEANPGIYQAATITGVAGRTYTLSVTAAGKTYTAVSKLNAPVQMDSLNTQKAFFGPLKNVHVYFNDPAGIENWYKIVKTVNDSVYRDIYVTPDLLRDGQQMEEILFTNNVEDSLRRGDSVTIALQCIDEGVYEYFRTLAPITEGNDPGATPANPKTNLSNGALGYFSAYAVTRKSLIVK